MESNEFGSSQTPTRSAADPWRLRPWSAWAVIHAWERGDGAGRTARALAILSILLPQRSRQELLDLPLGRRDTLLLQARTDLLGPTLQGNVRCPSCGAEQAFALEVDDDLLSQGVAIDAPGAIDFRYGDQVLGLRAPTGHDGLALESLRPTAAWRELMQRCVSLPEGDLFELPQAALEAIGEELERLDPLALIPLALSCGQCALEWQPLLEIVEVVWAEVENLARRLMDEAQTLAMAYGWSEKQIFSMSGRRRRYYLENAPAAAGGDEESPRPLAPPTWNPSS